MDKIAEREMDAAMLARERVYQADKIRRFAAVVKQPVAERPACSTTS